MGIQQTFWQSRSGYLQKIRPELPVLFFDPSELSKTIDTFRSGFNGMVTYAVKANPDPKILQHMFANNVIGFDVASAVEIDLVREHAPGATMHYNNPIRSISEIKYSVSNGIRCFSVDRIHELEKLLAHAPKDSEISVRLALDVNHAAYNFGTKFGASPDLCIQLLKRIKNSPCRASMTFHPGTQCDNPKAWVTYIQTCAHIAEQAKCSLHRLNVGGGFPSHRSGPKPNLTIFFNAIHKAVRSSFKDFVPALVCEPGRSLIASAQSLAVCVKARDENTLFLNDGIYSGLAEFKDIGHIGRYQVVSPLNIFDHSLYRPFTIFGPTCDSLDQLPAPLTLPDNIQEGDYILFENTGAYVSCMITRFNGYGEFETVTIPKTHSLIC